MENSNMPLLKTILFILLTLSSSISFSQNNTIQLNYSVEDNSLSLKSNQVKLKTILGLLSMKSGIQTAIHPDANKPVSISIKKQPLKQAIENLCKDFNCVTHYDSDPESGNSIITRLEVLPKGKYQAILLNDIVPLSNEMNIHAKSHQASKYTRIQKRLELRLNNLPEAIRISMSEEYARQIKHYQNKQAQREKRRAERNKDKAERDSFRQARINKLKKHDPERFALSEQRRLAQQQQDKH